MYPTYSHDPEGANLPRGSNSKLDTSRLGTGHDVTVLYHASCYGASYCSAVAMESLLYPLVSYCRMVPMEFLWSGHQTIDQLHRRAKEFNWRDVTSGCSPAAT